VNPYTAAAQPVAAPVGRQSNAIAVVAKAFRFSPATLDLSPGQRITFEFENQDEADHNIVSAEAAFSEVVLAGSQRRTIEWTAPSRPGTYTLVCTYHRGMEMTVTVK
jgi:plastocyanin